MRALLALLLVVPAAGALLRAAEPVYSGKWESSQNGSGGTVRVRLADPAEVTFTLSGEEVKTKVVSSKVDGDAFVIDYEFTAQGYTLRSVVKGTVKDGKLKATYETQVPGDPSTVDAGTVEAAADK